MGKFADELFRGLGDAITDIRQKAVEEPWFGRAVTEAGERQQSPEQEPEPSFGSHTHHLDVGPRHDQMQENANYRLAQMERECNDPQWPQAGHGRDQEHGRDIDIDR